MTQKIFISYRRDDSAGYAGRLYDRLVSHFGKDRVFMDVAGIEPGVDFVETIEKAVGSCSAFIVLIGRQWLAVTDAKGHRRLDDPSDFVRLEVFTALQRNIRVIPVLVQGATMPPAQDLPEALAKLARRNALEISDVRWDYDAGRLIETLDRVFTQQDRRAQKAGTTSPAPEKAGVQRVAQKPESARLTPIDISKQIGLSPRQGQYGAPGATPPQAPQKVIGSVAQPKAKAPQRKIVPEFYQRTAWWVSLGVLPIVSIGGAFLADWFLRWVLGLFRIELSPVSQGWLALVVAGLLWALVYVLVVILNDSQPEESFIFFVTPLVPYYDIFNAFEFSDFVRGLFLAFPLNFLWNWGVAHGLAWAAAEFLRASHDGVLFTVFGVLTLIAIGFYLAHSDVYGAGG